MPTYDYRCSACGREEEVMHGIHDHGPETCSACGGAMRKALSPPAIHFRGSGWAKKDAASARKSKPAASTRADASTSSDDATSAGGDKGASDASTSSSSDGTGTATTSADKASE